MIISFSSSVVEYEKNMFTRPSVELYENEKHQIQEGGVTFDGPLRS